MNQVRKNIRAATICLAAVWCIGCTSQRAPRPVHQNVVRTPQQALDAVVRVYVPTGKSANEFAQGVGINMTSGGIVTAMHVFGEPRTIKSRLARARIKPFQNGQRATPKTITVAGNTNTDVAILVPQPLIKTKRVAQISPSSPRKGERASALLMSTGRGNNRWTISKGTVVAFSDDGQFFVVSGTSVQGDSGGPVLNSRGQLLGIVIGGTSGEIASPFSIEWRRNGTFGIKYEYGPNTPRFRGDFIVCSRPVVR